MRIGCWEGQQTKTIGFPWCNASLHHLPQFSIGWNGSEARKVLWLLHKSSWIFESCCSYWLPEWKERRSYYSTAVKFAEISILSFRISALFPSFSSRYPCNGCCRVVVDVVVSLRIDNKARMSTKQTSPTSGKNKILYQCGARLEAMDYTLSWWVVLP